MSRFRSQSIFARLLIALFATTLLVQAMNFVVVLLVPVPEQHVTTLSSVAEALQSGPVGGTLESVSRPDLPTDNLQDGQERALAAALARALEVDEADVRVVLRRAATMSDLPVAPGDGRRPRRPLPGLPPPFANEAPAQGATMLIGGFEAGLRLPDSTWRIVSPTPSRIDRWPLEALSWLVASLLVVTPLAWFLARRLSDPIAQFASAAERLGKDPRAEPVELIGPPEIQSAAEAMNTMQSRLQRYVADRTTMIAAIAHDMRTPLMRLTLRLRNVPEDTRSAAERDIREMEQMLEAALSFTKDLFQSPPRERLSLFALLQTIIDEMADQGADVTLAEAEDVTLLADRSGLRRLLHNILANAIAYGERARVVLTVTADLAIVEIADDGPGIPEAEFERVFAPFYRLEGSRNRATGGTGLGLSSARAIARAHGGDIVLRNRDGGGLSVRVLLPR